MRENLRLSLHQDIGRKFENLVRDLLTHSFGLSVESVESWSATFDLVVNDKMIEVKAAYPTLRTVKNRKRERWQYNFTSKLDVDTEYYAILVAIDEDNNEYIYCIPGNEIDAPTVQLTSHPEKYSGKYAKYLYDFEGLINFLKES
jgi:hypothetical protein